MSLILGIDLGTTYSAAGITEDGIPNIVAYEGERIMPSVVGVSPEGAMLVGMPAQNQYMLYPEHTIRSVKRKMGQNIQVQLGDRTYTPQEISGIILREIKRRAEEHLGQTVDRAVITVPAYFSDAARQATYEAGHVAGLTVERIINEPTAAALAYGLDRSDEHQCIAVYDLGGGTFDVSIIEMDAGVVEVRASHGNTQLGGDDFDERLVDYFAEQFIEEYGIDPREDRRALARLTRAAEGAKIALSSKPFVKVREEYLITHEGRAMHLDLELSRLQFEEMITDLVAGTLESLDAALKDAEIQVDTLDRILFVGGSTRIPLVWQMVHNHTGINPDMTVNPDEAVALGAAVQAAIIAGEPLDSILVDVTPHSLGIEVAEWQFGRLVPDRYSVIIQRNTTIPTSRSEVYSAIHPSQTSIEIKVYQGEHTVASRNTLLGTFMFDQLKPEAPDLPPRITVQFDFDVNGILHVSATDRGSGKEAHQTVKAARVKLSPSDIADTRTVLDEFDESALSAQDAGDADTVVIEADSEVEALLARARRVLARSKSDTTALSKAIASLEGAIKVGDEAAMQECTEELLDALYDVDDEEE